ncbi:ATPase family associated with various cellular activities (AAA) [Sanguibacter gelidistatuariae]|uniref:ATPase family associated with various cellular activities (AAA) n=1 Tax=Sanguibacter gelidistatuariae TaxID=1814289 RepID=A0A1G6SAT5_9MICO|nr:ATP-binding protein [Sanguibacter gelidistatuariae]SDD14020.1 ATPase family associated with various cellular activities (AAA) [Sanguibacter gelidistatuariae]
MANAEYLTELVRAHYSGDNRRFSNLLNQVIAAESRAGHSRLAERLRELRIEGSRPDSAAQATPLARAPRNLEQILSVGYSDTKLTDLVLTPQARVALERYVVEQRRAHVLADHGLKPRRRLLLHGPPGCGKTMTAQALAGELQLPLIRVRLEVVFSKYLGETASTLADVFAEATRVRGVYLFDEFDALGRTRLDDSEVGEMKRVVTTFLQLLDSDHSDSLLVAATNTGHALDSALFRRFDDVLELPEPTEEQRQEMLTRLLRPWRLKATGDLVEETAGLSFADIRAAVEDAHKDAILSDQPRPSREIVVDRLAERRSRVPTRIIKRY